MSKICENCNKEILDENISCPYCGFEFKQEQYIRNIGDYCVIITFSGDDMENLKAGFSTVD